MSNELLKELGIEGVAELIAERFDDAVDLMHSNAIVYGGAIRDILAGMPLQGDLDIATDGYSYKDTSKSFRKSPKWTEQGRRWQPLSIATATKSGRTVSGRTTSNNPSRFKSPPSSSPYEDTNMPVADTTSFVTYNDAKVQVVMAKGQSSDSFDAALDIVKHVDFICCGLAMDNTGRVFEVIEGAYEDCKNKVLRLNKTTKNISVDNLKKRIAKLKNRGWESKINISAIKKKIEKAHKARVAEEKKQMKTQQKNAKIAPFDRMTQQCAYIAVKESNTGPFKNYIIEFSRRKYESTFGASRRDFVGLTRILNAIVTTANTAGMKISHKPGPADRINIDIMSKKTSAATVYHYAEILEDALEDLAFKHGGQHPKKAPKKKIRKSPYDAFAESKFSDRHTNLGTKLRGKPISRGEEMSLAGRQSESVHPAGHSDMSFKAIMAPDGQIMINPIEVGGTDSSNNGVTIDVSDLPPDAAEQLRSALNNAEPEDMTTPPEAELEDMTTPEETPTKAYYSRAHGERVPDHEVQEIGRVSDEDAYLNKFNEIGENPDEG
jgi:hypothetical protein